MQRNVPSKSLQWCDVFFPSRGWERIQLQLSPEPAPAPFVGLSGFSPRARGEGGGGSWWGKWGGIGAKCVRIWFLRFFHAVFKNVYFLSFHVSTVIGISAITNQELSGHVIKIYIKFLWPHLTVTTAIVLLRAVWRHFLSLARDRVFLKSSLTGFSLLSFWILFPPVDFPLKRDV